MKNLFIVFTIVLSFKSFAQVIDFESIQDKEPGEAINFMTLGDNPCQLRFFIGHNLEDTTHLTLQKIGLTVKNENGLTGGFQGIKNDKNCHEKAIPQTRMNQINYNPFVLNSEINNRDRVGCHFVSTILRGESLPSVFIHFSIPTKGCSGDILDLDGANDAIEAYEIYYYASKKDFPNNPIDNDPIKIRTTGESFGKGEIGEDGGVVPFKITSDIGFTIIEIRPNQQVSPENKFRDVFGFALDNFSPFSVEQAPYLPPYISGEIIEISTVEPIEVEIPEFEPVFFDFDKSIVKSEEQLASLVEFLLSYPFRKVKITGYADAKGSKNYNLRLSKRRVEAVKKALLTKGVLAKQIITNYEGEIEDEQQSDEEKRRVDIKIID